MATTYRNQYSPKGEDVWTTLDLRNHGYAKDFANADDARRTLKLVADSERYDYRLVKVTDESLEVL